jgi:hypothetical protein
MLKACSAACYYHASPFAIEFMGLKVCEKGFHVNVSENTGV